MSLDNFTRHLAAVTVAVLALGFSGAAIYLFIIGHPVPALLASLASGTTGYLLPSPLASRVTVENDTSDPVPTAAVK